MWRQCTIYTNGHVVYTIAIRAHGCDDTQLARDTSDETLAAATRRQQPSRWAGTKLADVKRNECPLPTPLHAKAAA